MRRYILNLLILSLSLSSCNDNDLVDDVKSNTNSKKVMLTTEEFVSIASDKPRIINEDEVINRVKLFIEGERKSDKTLLKSQEKIKEYSIKVVDRDLFGISNNGKKTKSNKSKETDSEEIPIYSVDVEFENSKDILIVSGDDRTSSILAYYTIDNPEEKSISTEDMQESIDLLTKLSIYSMLDELDEIDYIQDSLRESTLEKIAGELGIAKEEINIENIESHIEVMGSKTKASIIQDPSNIDGVIAARYGPYCHVRWSNGMPYNRSMPQGCPNNWLWDNRYAVSPVVIAIAQAFTHIKPELFVNGRYIDWPYLTENEEIHETYDYFGSYAADPVERRIMIGDLMKYISDQCQITYSCNGSSYYVNNMTNFLNRNGILIDGRQNLDIDKMKQSIFDINPIIMGGKTSSDEGHTWLVDGLLSVVSQSGRGGERASYYIHANMGYGKSYAGYFLIPNSRSSGRPSYGGGRTIAYAESRSGSGRPGSGGSDRPNYTGGGRGNSLTFDTGFAHFQKDITMMINMRRK